MPLGAPARPAKPRDQRTVAAPGAATRLPLLPIDTVLVLLPLALAGLVLLPRLLSAQFGLLDDGVTLRATRLLREDWLLSMSMASEAGRFFPVYWLFNTLLNLVAGSAPTSYFLANYLLLASSAVAIAWLVRLHGGTILQSSAAAVFFLTAGPVVESYYTLSKQEPLQILLFLLSLLFLRLHQRARRRLPKTIAALGILIALILANLTKETSVVVVPIAFVWLLLSLRFRTPSVRSLQLSLAVYLLAGILSAAIFVALRIQFLPTPASDGVYTSMYRPELPIILAGASRWCRWLLRDFLYLLPLLVCLIATFCTQRQSVKWLLVAALVWILGFIAIYLPWYSLLEYYMLPLTIGTAAIAGVAFGAAFTALRSAVGRDRRTLSAACLALGVALWLVAVMNNITNAQVQLAVDVVNWDMVQSMTTLPYYSTIIVNMPKNSEYMYELGVHLAENRQRPDIKVLSMEQILDTLASLNGSVYLLTLYIDNQPFPSVRINAHEPSNKYWNQQLEVILPADAIVVYDDNRQVQLLDIGLDRPLCSVTVLTQLDASLCNVPRPVIDQRVMTYGWRAYAVGSEANTEERLGRLMR